MVPASLLASLASLGASLVRRSAYFESWSPSKLLVDQENIQKFLDEFSDVLVLGDGPFKKDGKL